MPNPRYEPETELTAETPKMYTVIMLNDDYTTMDFVVFILMKVFSKNQTEAGRIMMDIHSNGEGVAGNYIYDIAVSKKIKCDQLAAEQGFPLKLVIKLAG